MIRAAPFYFLRGVLVDSYVQIAERLGIPTAILAGVFFAIWICLRWGAKHIAGPLTRSHIELVTTTRSEITTQSESLDRIAANQAKHIDLTEESGKKLDRLIQLAEQNGGRRRGEEEGDEG